MHSPDGPVDAAGLADDENVWRMLDRAILDHGDRVAIAHRTDGDWQAVTYRRLGELVADADARLRRLGLGPADRIAIMGDTSLDWAVADFAALRTGAVVVPIFPTSSAEQVRHIVDVTRPVVAVADSDERRRLLTDAGTPVVLDGAAVPLAPDVPAEVTAGDDPAGDKPAPRPVRAHEVATIVFTSGTTGEPKGCILTHRNVYCGTANVAAAVHELFAPPDGTIPRTVVALPLSHMYGRSTLLATLLAGGEAVLIRHPAELFDAMRHQPPTFLSLTPYLLEKLDRAVRENELADVEGTTTALRWLRVVICGGASLSLNHHDAFRQRGITILGAYGMTESAAAATINRPANNRIGSVGLPNPGTSVTLDDDSELVITGGNVSPGYWGEIDPDQCGPGPFSVRTGDLGIVDDRGFVWITGRRKEILITSSGKNVAPALLEDRVRAHPLIAHCVVVGDKRPYVAALINVDRAEIRRRKLAGAELDAAIQVAVDSANAFVSRAESIRRFRILPTEFSIASGHVTASGKIIRAKVIADFATEIEALYS